MEEHEHIHGEDRSEHEHHHHHHHEHEHHHHHHEHEHEHHHHHHHHEHDEDGACSCHEHEHEHEHVHGRDVDGIHIEHHIHEGACVVSGATGVIGVYETLRPRISAELEKVAAEVTSLGGIVGHIKASAEVKTTEMFSVTETDAMIKTAPTQEITVRMAAIVFAVTPEETEPLVEAALRGLRA